MNLYVNKIKTWLLRFVYNVSYESSDDHHPDEQGQHRVHQLTMKISQINYVTAKSEFKSSKV